MRNYLKVKTKNYSSQQIKEEFYPQGEWNTQEEVSAKIRSRPWLWLWLTKQQRRVCAAALVEIARNVPSSAGKTEQRGVPLESCCYKTTHWGSEGVGRGRRGVGNKAKLQAAECQPPCHADPGEATQASVLAEPGSNPFSCSVSPVPSTDKTYSLPSGKKNKNKNNKLKEAFSFSKTRQQRVNLEVRGNKLVTGTEEHQN